VAWISDSRRHCCKQKTPRAIAGFFFVQGTANIVADVAIVHPEVSGSVAPAGRIVPVGGALVSAGHWQSELAANLLLRVQQVLPGLR
jgi:hypothetical protein